MRISTLLTHLPEGATEKLLLADPEADVYTIGFLTENKCLRNDVLYFGDSTLLATATLPESPNLLLYGSNPDDETVKQLVDANVAFLVEDANPFECYNALQACFLENQEQQSVIRRMMEAHFSNGGLQYLVEEAAMALGNPIVVVDTTYHYIAHHLGQLEGSTSTLAQTITDEVRLQTLPDHVVTYIRDERIDSTLAAQGGPLIHHNAILDCTTMTGAVMVHGVCIAHVMMMEHQHRFRDIDRGCFVRLLEFVGQEMQKSEVWGPTSGELGSYFLTNLLGNQRPSEAVTLRRLRSLNFHPKPVLRVICLHAPQEGLRQDQVELIAGQLRPMLHHALYTRYHCQLVILVSRDEDDDLMQSSGSLLHEVASLNGLMVGLSNAFTRMTETRRAYDQARLALRMGKLATPLFDQEGVYEYSDYAYFGLFEIANRRTNLLSLCHPSLLRLQAYDERHGSELMETLYVFLQVTGTTKRAAEILNLHKNTLLYRINRIKELIDLDLASGEDQYILQTGFRVLAYLGIFAPRTSASREELRG